jgi:S1-C subfamily serine protease
VTLVLRVLSGARAGHVVTTDAERVTIGRAERATLRFDPARDLEVSAAHASITRDATCITLRDENSRNGTFVNGVRISGDVRIHDSDRIVFGTGGPEVELRVLDRARTAAYPAATAPPAADASHRAPPGPRGRSTEPRGPAAARRSKRWPIAAGATALLLAGGAVAEVVQSRRQRGEWEQERSTLLARVDSTLAAGEQSIALLQGEIDGLAEVLRATTDQVATAAAAVADAQRSGRTEQLPALRNRLETALATLNHQQGAAALDHSAIRDRNTRAVAKVYVERADGTVATGTAFAVRPDGTLVTARHVVAPDGSPPRRIAVQFSLSDQVWPARVLAADGAADIAIVAVDGILGNVPTVDAFNLRTDTLARGAPVILIGYPLGGESEASDRPGRRIVRPVLTAAALTSISAAALELEGYGATGSSGSPVFDGNGLVVGMAFGGRNADGGHYLVAVPAVAVVRLLQSFTRH